MSDRAAVAFAALRAEWTPEDFRADVLRHLYHACEHGAAARLLADAEAERDALRAVVEQVRALHQVVMYQPHPGEGLVTDPNDEPLAGCPVCESCGPCPTLALLPEATS